MDDNDVALSLQILFQMLVALWVTLAERRRADYDGHSQDLLDGTYHASLEQAP